MASARSKAGWAAAAVVVTLALVGLETRARLAGSTYLSFQFSLESRHVSHAGRGGASSGCKPAAAALPTADGNGTADGNTTAAGSGKLHDALRSAYGLSDEAAARLFAATPKLLQRGLQRGLLSMGDPSRLRRVAHKLLSGQNITAQAVGGSITGGQGAVHGWPYVDLLFTWIRNTFPGHHNLKKSGMGGGGSHIFMVCANHVVAPETDLVFIEFAINDGDGGYPGVKNIELLVRKLLKLPSRPAVVVMNSYSWIMLVGGKLDEDKPWAPFWPASGGSFGMLGQYYGLPVLSMRSAAYPLFLRRVPGYKPNLAIAANLDKITTPELEAEYYYWDSHHPAGGTGHTYMGDVASAVLQEAVADLAERPYGEADEAAAAAELPPPSIEGNHARRSSTCLLGKETEGLLVRQAGFQMGDEDRNKWGWIASQPGSELVLRVDTSNEKFVAPPGVAKAPKDANASAVGPPIQNEVVLAFLHSYEHMGKAKIECIANCECEPATADFTWEKKESQTDLTRLKASQHADCQLKITVLPETSDPLGGHKVKLLGVMVAEYGASLNGAGVHVDLIW